jgi:hypothetical protein
MTSAIVPVAKTTELPDIRRVLSISQPMCYLTYAQLYFAAKAKTPKTRKDVYEKLGQIFPKNETVK